MDATSTAEEIYRRVLDRAQRYCAKYNQRSSPNSTYDDSDDDLEGYATIRELVETRDCWGDNLAYEIERAICNSEVEARGLILDDEMNESDDQIYTQICKAASEAIRRWLDTFGNMSVEAFAAAGSIAVPTSDRKA